MSMMPELNVSYLILLIEMIVSYVFLISEGF
jgi:hypothetical protein